MAAPVMTANALGNALASGTIVASGTANFNLDFSAKFEGQLVVQGNFGTIAATAGLQIQIFARFDSTPTNATTNPNFTYTIPAVSGLQYSPRIYLPTGVYHVIITNLDASNSVTVVQATADSVDSIS